MKTLKLAVTLLVLLTGTMHLQATDRWVCQDCDPLWTNTYSTISAAINAASSGDTIYIHAEEYPIGSESIIEYDEQIMIDKEIVLTCLNRHTSYGWPIVKINSFVSDEIIHITENGAGSEISNLIIKGPTNSLSIYTGDSLFSKDENVGIRMEAEDCLVDNCEITYCNTGIYIDSTTGNVVSNCQIGDRWWLSEDKPPTIDYYYEEYWTDTGGPASTQIIHPGNGFGIVIVAPTWSRIENVDYIDYYKNEIVDCTIRSNRYYGVVLTNGSRAHIAHNVIAWNGNDNGSNTSTTLPVKTGGILSLFTDDQIAANDNKMQSPTILSNSIYGNKGYQIGIITEESDYTHIYNSPVIIANDIGVETNMPIDPSDPEYNFLISCGPTPNVTVTPTPETPPDDPPDAMFCEFDYDYHGSSAILAWNCLNDSTDMKLEVYHPLQKMNLPFNITATPTPSSTSGLPTHTPAPFIPCQMPTGVPWSPTPSPSTPVPTNTHKPDFHALDDYSWSLKSIKKDPMHFGWVDDPSFEPPLYYDWHYKDFNPSQVITPTPTPDPNHTPTPTPDPNSTATPTPTITPFSKCFEGGGFFLYPGSTTSTMSRDIGFADLGYHREKELPTVNQLTSSVNKGKYSIQWMRPEYWPDGSIFSVNDIGGYVILLAEIPSNSNFARPTFYGDPIYVVSNANGWDEIDAPKEVTHFGVYLYDVQGMQSDAVWVEKPEE